GGLAREFAVVHSSLPGVDERAPVLAVWCRCDDGCGPVGVQTRQAGSVQDALHDALPALVTGEVPTRVQVAVRLSNDPVPDEGQRGPDHLAAMLGEIRTKIGMPPATFGY